MPILGSVGAGSGKGFGLTAGVAGYNVEYLVVGGGGSGGDGDAGGGGAGGLLTATGLFLTEGEEYTITVGAAVAGVTGSGPHVGNQGNDSIISGAGVTTITGGGGGHGSGWPSAGGDGSATNGSGGACYYGDALPGSGDGTGGDAGDQSNSPDWPSITAPSYGAAGGGGASQDGGYGSNTYGGNGGDGIQSDIIEAGTDVWYAGGGGGKVHTGTPGQGGQGGGGNGSVGHGPSGVAGTANTGGGGGGTNDGTSGGGASGLVVLRLLSTKWSGTVTGSPTETTDGDYKVLKFTGDGSYTA